MITASVQNHRISPRKVRLVADMIRGKNVLLAKIILTNASKKAKHPIHDLLNSAIANALHNHKIESENLFVKEIRVDQGFVMKRSMPVSHGSAHPIKKRTSHISLVLATRGEKTQAVKKVAAAKTPKVKAKKDL